MKVRIIQMLIELVNEILLSIHDKIGQTTK